MKWFDYKTKKLPAPAQKGLFPRKEFLVRGKERFLAAFDASGLAADGTGARSASGWRAALVFKVGIGAMAVLCIGVGLSAYADTANVPATSPLYLLKRLGENVQLEFAPAAEKPQLQATFAVRRANEIAALQTSAPSSTLIPQLTSELDQDISNSLGAAPAPTSTASALTSTSTPDESASDSGHHYRYAHTNIGAEASATPAVAAPMPTPIVAVATSSVAAGPINIYCTAFDVSTSSVFFGHLEKSLALRPDALAKFNKQCGSESNMNPAMPPASSPASSTTVRVHDPRSSLIGL